MYVFFGCHERCCYLTHEAVIAVFKCARCAEGAGIFEAAVDDVAAHCVGAHIVDCANSKPCLYLDNTHKHTHNYIHIHLYLYTYMPTYIHEYIHRLAHTYIYTHSHTTRTHTYTHKHIHTHTVCERKGDRER